MTLVQGPVARVRCFQVGGESVTVTGRQSMPEEGGTQAPALRNRVDSDHRQKPQFARWVKLSHLLDYGIEVAQDLIAAALGDNFPERCFIGFDAGGSHRATAAKFSSRCAVPQSNARPA